jgi:hypothetical protein
VACRQRESIPEQLAGTIHPRGDVAGERGGLFVNSLRLLVKPASRKPCIRAPSPTVIIPINPALSNRETMSCAFQTSHRHSAKGIVCTRAFSGHLGSICKRPSSGNTPLPATVSRRMFAGKVRVLPKAVPDRLPSGSKRPWSRRYSSLRTPLPDSYKPCG